MDPIKGFFKGLIRRKPIEVDMENTQLKRCLTTFDLTALGIGSTLGLGIYVLAGQVASDKAGPAVTLSFLIAAIASVFAGLCYAEFGARVPRAGSAYVYSYVTVGEFMAFIIGWNLILEYVIGTASVARGYSGYIDSLCNGTIQQHFRNVMPMNLPDMSPYPDFLALGITLFLTVMLAIGVKESSRFNNLFTGLNLLVVLFAIIAGALKSNVSNWQIDTSNMTNQTFSSDVGSGGFFPFGISGMMSGAATCFYGFIGFDCIATTGEEVKNPQKSIPISIVLSLLFVFLAYFGVSAVQTLMVPYYMQNLPAPLPFVFDYVGWTWAGWAISIGALAGLSTSLLGAMFPLPRVLYAMASDGVIFRFFAKVNPKLKTPLIATLFSGVFAGCMAMLFDVHELADMMSIGTLLAYSLVAISVLILRYKPDASNKSVKSSPAYTTIDNNVDKGELDIQSKSRSLSSSLEKIAYSDCFRMLLNLDRYKIPTDLTAKISIIITTVLTALIIALDGILAWAEESLFRGDVVTITFMAIVAVLIVIFTVMLCRQPVEDKKLSFKVPLVPFIPLLSVFVNVYLMFKLSLLTWKRFGAWMAIGFAVYFFYGLWNSSERSVPPATVVTYYTNGANSDRTALGRNDSSAKIINSTAQSSVGSHMSSMTTSCESVKLVPSPPVENSNL